jgi:bacteriorhodopsin
MNYLLLNMEAVKLAPDDYVGFTFFIGAMAMLGASLFFFLSLSTFDRKWRTSVLVSGLITFIAAVHYLYMRDYWGEFGESPTYLRYVDWILTVPLMCVEFYLLLRPAGAKQSFLWKLILAAVVMLVAGYIGEAFTDGTMTHSVMWGVISTLGYAYILYSAWLGEAAQLAKGSGNEAVQKGIKALAWFVLVGWAIYPIGYMAMPGGWLGADGAGLLKPSDLDLIYNIGDAINKIGFGLVVYTIAMSETKKAKAARGEKV